MASGAVIVSTQVTAPSAGFNGGLTIVATAKFNYTAARKDYVIGLTSNKASNRTLYGHTALSFSVSP